MILSISVIKGNQALGILPANPVSVEDEIFFDLRFHSPGLPNGSNEAAFLAAAPNKNLFLMIYVSAAFLP